MRWKHKLPPRQGTTRSVKRFLFVPLTLQNETRWLEMALIDQFFQQAWVDDRGKKTGNCWKNRSWDDANDQT